MRLFIAIQLSDEMKKSHTNASAEGGYDGEKGISYEIGTEKRKSVLQRTVRQKIISNLTFSFPRAGNLHHRLNYLVEQLGLLCVCRLIVHLFPLSPARDQVSGLELF